jgi:hypothetical protein
MLRDSSFATYLFLPRSGKAKSPPTWCLGLCHFPHAQYRYLDSIILSTRRPAPPPRSEADLSSSQPRTSSSDYRSFVRKTSFCSNIRLCEVVLERGCSSMMYLQKHIPDSPLRLDKRKTADFVQMSSSAPTLPLLRQFNEPYGHYFWSRLHSSTTLTPSVKAMSLSSPGSPMGFFQQIEERIIPQSFFIYTPSFHISQLWHTLVHGWDIGWHCELRCMGKWCIFLEISMSSLACVLYRYGPLGRMSKSKDVRL